MGIAQIPAASGGLAVARFPATIGAPFQVPAGLTLQNTVTSTTTFSAGQLPAQVWAVIVGAGGSGGANMGGTEGSGGGGGGGTCIGWVDVPSAGITATIGSGGASVSAGSAGNPGGNTTFGSYIAYGGGGGERDTGSNYNLTEASSTVSPNGPGGGYGGVSFRNTSNNTIPLIKGAPFNDVAFVSAWQATTTGSVANNWVNSNAYRNNYVGGGMGGTNSGANSNYRIGANGHTGGGGVGISGAGADGGNSSRSNGLTNNFTGGTGSTNSGGGGGGAGFLANGSTTTLNTGAAGGSGGGGGGGGQNGTSGAGGNGCVLIYYQEIK